MGGVRLAGQNEKLRMKESYSQSLEKVKTTIVDNKEKKEKVDKDAEESKKLSGVEKKHLGPGNKRDTLGGELLRS